MDFGAFLNSFFGLGDLPRTVDFCVGTRPIRASVPEDSVFFSIKDILYNREYEVYPEFELTNPRKIVVDAGAHAGLYSLIASLYSKNVIALEPDADNFGTLSSNVEVNQLDNITLLKSALWTADGVVGFGKRANSQLGSIDTDIGTPSVSTSSVDSVTISGLLDRIEQFTGHREIDLLKLDIEGAEFDVISSCDPHTLRQVTKIVAEIHIHHGDLKVLMDKLHQCGFNYVILKRPLRKKFDGNIRVVSDYRSKFMVGVVNGIMTLSGYHDQSSLLLFASRSSNDLSGRTEAKLLGKIVESSLSRTT